jgi:hypothetical protein
MTNRTVIIEYVAADDSKAQAIMATSLPDLEVP